MQKAKKIGKKKKSLFNFGGPTLRLLLGLVAFIIIVHYLCLFWIFYGKIEIENNVDD